MGRFDNINDSDLSLEELNIKYPTFVIPDHPNYFENKINNDLIFRIYNDDGKVPRFHIKNINSNEFSIINIITLDYNVDNKFNISENDKNNLSDWLVQLSTSEEIIEKLPFLKRNNWKNLIEIWNGMGNYQPDIQHLNFDKPIINFY